LLRAVHYSVLPFSMIELRHVAKSYAPDKAALKDITLSVEQGEFVFLAGPSGAGKTTLLKLLFRDEEPSAGQILFHGQDIGRLNSRGVARLRRQIGLVFQEFKLLPRLSALDNVSLAAEIIGVPKKESHARARRLLSELGLEKSYHARPLALSGGEQQRVAIARALINQPALVLADEPTGNLDSVIADEIMRLFVKMRERGTTLIVASHDLTLIKRFGTRIIYLREGHIADDLERVGGAVRRA
jgi:cell division transport system ATP-binding protein